MQDDYKQLSDTAYSLHTSGKLSEAKPLYEKLIDSNPNDINLQYLYAQLCLSLKDYDKAFSILNAIYEKYKLEIVLSDISTIYFYKKNYDKVIETINLISSKNDLNYRLLALSCMKKELYNEAKEYFFKIKDLKNSFDDLYNISVCYNFLKDYDNSLDYAFKAYTINPDDYDLNIHIAYIYQHAQMDREELPFIIKASQIKPNIDLFFRIASIYKHNRMYDLSIAYYKEILNLDPSNKKAMMCIAISLKYIDKREASEFLDNVMKVFPNDEEVILYNYFINNNMMNSQKCYDLISKLVDIEPNNEFYRITKAATCIDLYKYTEAEEIYKKLLEAKPDCDTAKIELADLYSQLGKVQEAFSLVNELKDNEKAMSELMFVFLRSKILDDRIKPIFIKHHSKLNSSDECDKKAMKMFYHLKVAEKYNINEELFVQLRRNLVQDDIKILSEYKSKIWNGSNPENTKLLIFSGHGAGDFILSLRYINSLKNKCKKLIIQAPNSLYDLVVYNFPDIDVYKTNEKVPESEYDYTLPAFCSLVYEGSDLNNIYASEGYLDIQESLIQEKSKLDCLNTSKKKVGIFWQGNPSIFFNRSIELKYFKELSEVENIQLYSFQMGSAILGNKQLMNDFNIINLAPYIHNYSDTGALLKNIDVLITIDTSIAHLAGAMGIKTYLLLPYFTEWRWFYDTETTPWYNSIKIFKQESPGDWNSVILRVKNELRV